MPPRNVLSFICYLLILAIEPDSISDSFSDSVSDFVLGFVLNTILFSNTLLNSVWFCVFAFRSCACVMQSLSASLNASEVMVAPEMPSNSADWAASAFRIRTSPDSAPILDVSPETSVEILIILFSLKIVDTVISLEIPEAEAR